MELDQVLKLVTVTAQASIPIAIFYAGRIIARGQYTKSMQDAWNEVNKLIIANEHNVRVAREFMAPDFARKSDDDCRKAYMAFVLLNTFTSFYFGTKHGLLDKTYQRENFKDLLGLALADDDVYTLSQSRGYHPKFKALCREVKQSLASSQANEP